MVNALLQKILLGGGVFAKFVKASQLKKPWNSVEVFINFDVDLENNLDINSPLFILLLA